MGSSKRRERNSKLQAQLRSRTTRSKGKLLADPAQNTQLLTDQLRALGLYAAPTLGDGNCLFRALSDQLYGTPSHHLQLRKSICDWIEAHKQRYEPFVEDERGLDVHLRCMREPGTYGGHLELSAFAHLMRRDVKVVQPGLVYVIEWATGGDLTPDRPPNPELPSFETDPTLNEREKRRLRRDQKRAEKEKAEQPAPTNELDSSSCTVYVAYHDWEHFSSIRNLKGPHAGLPHVVEIPAESDPQLPKKKQKIKTRPKLENHPSPPKHPPKIRQASAEVTVDPPQSPQISPPSTPSSSHSPPPFSDPTDDLLHPPYPHSTASPPTSTGDTSSGSSLPIINLRIRRSPKRAFDESSLSSIESAAKRSRSSRVSTPDTRQSLPSRDNSDASMDIDGAPGERDLESTPGLSAPGSSAESTSSSDVSPPPIATIIASPPSLPPPPPLPEERRLTRRQRKALGLPKARAALVASANARNSHGTGSSGRIVIPGGRFKNGISPMGASARVRDGGGGDDDEQDDDDEGDAEWKRNGTGRVDVRGFRELKI